MANYQREVALARALASRGIAAQRFHYRGTGNSQGDPATLSFDTLCEDAREMSKALRHRVPNVPVAFVGTRWGALMAAEVSKRFPFSPLVLWEPTIDASGYFREAGRARRIRDAREGRSDEARSNGVAAEFESRGFMDLLGYSIYRPLYESAQGRTLSSVMDRQPHPLLIIQMARGKSRGGAFESLVGKLAEAGYEAEVEQAELAESWWFHTDAVLRFRPLIQRTCEWLERRFTLSNRRGGT
jgi:pimeloyl-ACP methyl ester carboxylesterase